VTVGSGKPPPVVSSSCDGFVVLFCIVGVALWGLPFYYDFMRPAVAGRVRK